MNHGEIVLREDTHPDVRFYYREQFKIYHEPYLIWNWITWETVLSSCTVYRIEVDGAYAGDVIFEEKGRGGLYLVDFSVLPEYQGGGFGKEVLERVKTMARKLTATTRKETLGFFLKAGFVLRKTLRDFYDDGVDGYDVIYVRSRSIPRRTPARRRHARQFR